MTFIKQFVPKVIPFVVAVAIVAPIVNAFDVVVESNVSVLIDPPDAVDIIPVDDVEILPDVEIFPEPVIDPNTFNASPDGNDMPPSAVINPDADIAPHVIPPVPNAKDVPVIVPTVFIDAFAVAAFL